MSLWHNLFQQKQCSIFPVSESSTKSYTLLSRMRVNDHTHLKDPKWLGFISSNALSHALHQLTWILWILHVHTDTFLTHCVAHILHISAQFSPPQWEIPQPNYLKVQPNTLTRHSLFLILLNFSLQHLLLSDILYFYLFIMSFSH